MSEVRHTGTACPNCRQILNASSGVGHDEPPTEGDWTLCFYCTAPLVYADELTLRIPSADELRDMLADKEFVYALTAVQTYRFGQTSGETRH